MSEPLIVQTLTQKRAEILGRIKAYEAQNAQAEHDLRPVPVPRDALEAACETAEAVSA